MNLPNSLRFAATLALASVSAHAFTETWTPGGDSQGWTSLALADAYAHQQDFNGGLELSAVNYSRYFAIADADASGGAFTGDYLSFGSLTFDLTIASTSTVDTLAVRLADSASGHEWTYALTFTLGATTQFSVPLFPAGTTGTGWSQQSGPNGDFLNALASVEELSFVFDAADTVGISENFRATLDNVTLVAIPEPSSFAALAGLSTLGAALARRRRR